MASSVPKDPQQIEITVEPGVDRQRIDSYLGGHAGIKLSRSRAQKLIDDGHILLNGEGVSNKSQVKTGDIISVTLVMPPPSDVKAEDIPLDIIFEDDFLAVVNKPAGMVTHPGAGNYSGTLVNALIYHFKKLSSGSGPDRPGVVHRLDKETSGLLLVAKTDEVYQTLQKALQAREIKRTYLAVICGHVKKEDGTIDLPIGRSARDRKKMAVTDTAGRQAVTQYKLIKRYRSYDLLEVNLMTGRTHQIRVHFSHQGHPVFGDPDYGGREKWHRGIFAPERQFAKELLALIRRQALHAKQLGFVHPVSGENILLEAKLPADFAKLLAALDESGA